MEEIAEIVINTEHMAKISLKMYEEWEKDMKPPVFAIVPFKEWLIELIARIDEQE